MDRPTHHELPSAGPEAEIALRTLTALGESTEGRIEPATHMRDLLAAASRHCQKLVGAEIARIWLLRRGGRWLIAREFGAGESVERRLRRNEGLAGWAIQLGEPLRVAAGGPRPQLTGPVASYRGALVVPLFRRGKVFGAIECLDKVEGDFTDIDLDHLATASEHIAFALDNALLFEETERRALEKEVLLEVSRTLSSKLDFDEVIAAILRVLRQVVDYDAASIYLVNRKTLALELVAEQGYPEGSERAFQLQVGQGIVGWVAKTGDAVIVPDVQSDSRYVVARAGDAQRAGGAAGRRGAADRRLQPRERSRRRLPRRPPRDRAVVRRAGRGRGRARAAHPRAARTPPAREGARDRARDPGVVPAGACAQGPGVRDRGGVVPSRRGRRRLLRLHPGVRDTLGARGRGRLGQGHPAALLMAGFRMSLLAEIRNEFAIRAVMRKVNSLIHESTDRDKFVTAFYGVLDFKHRALIFSNGGHNPPILMRKDGSIEYLVEGGVALGVLAGARATRSGRSRSTPETCSCSTPTASPRRSPPPRSSSARSVSSTS